LKLNVPNVLTWLRIATIPVFVWCFFSEIEFSRPIAGLLFGFAAITDLLDGYAARKLGQTSRFGAFLDPVADKLMVTIALVLLVQGDPRVTVAMIAVVIIGREITVSALREWMATVGERAHVAVSWSGKLKTVFQMFGIAFMVYQSPLFGFPVYPIGYWLLVVASVMTLWSMIVYLKAAGPALNAD
jgi:CDP-diacylglycerol--glycerol-3-phosphate 3-phosphatidyltransferase/cardiolipin synthase